MISLDVLSFYYRYASDAALYSQSFEEVSANPGTVRYFVHASRSVNFIHFDSLVLAHFFDYSTFGVNSSG